MNAITDRGGGGVGWSKTEQRVFALFVVAIVVSLFFLVHPWYDRTHDGSVYLLTARSIAAGDGYSYLGETFRIRPPGFSALLAPVVGAAGEIDFSALNWLVSLFGAAGVVLLYLHQRTHLGWVLALLTSTAVWLNPGYQRLCNQVMSDVPGLALLLGCLWLERWASRRPSWPREVVLGLAIGVSIYVRSITVLLVPAILIARVAGGWKRAAGKSCRVSFTLRRLVLFAALGWLVMLPWNVVKRQHAPPPPADQTLNYSISTAMWHQDPGDPSSPRVSMRQILDRIPPRLADVGQVLGSRLQHRIPGSSPPDRGARYVRDLVAVGMLVCLLLVLVRRRAPAEAFASAVLLVVAVYFIFTDRLVLPVFVFALAASVEVLRGLTLRLAGARAATLVPALALLLLIAVDFAPRHEWKTIESRHQEFTATASAIEPVIEADSRLGAGQGFHYGVYLDRPVYSLMHAVRRARTPEAAEAVIDRYGLDTVVLSPLVPADRPFFAYFTARYGPGTTAGSARVWRVRR